MVKPGFHTNHCPSKQLETPTCPFSGKHRCLPRKSPNYFVPQQLLLCFDPLFKAPQQLCPQRGPGGDLDGPGTHSCWGSAKQISRAVPEGEQGARAANLSSSPPSGLALCHIHYSHFEQLSSLFRLCLNRQASGTNEKSPNYYGGFSFDWPETFKFTSLELVPLSWRSSLL